eukprot:tig00020892_g14923.t1
MDEGGESDREGGGRESGDEQHPATVAAAGSTEAPSRASSSSSTSTAPAGTAPGPAPPTARALDGDSPAASEALARARTSSAGGGVGRPLSAAASVASNRDEDVPLRSSSGPGGPGVEPLASPGPTSPTSRSSSSAARRESSAETLAQARSAASAGGVGRALSGASDGGEGAALRSGSGPGGPGGPGAHPLSPNSTSRAPSAAAPTAVRGDFGVPGEEEGPPLPAADGAPAPPTLRGAPPRRAPLVKAKTMILDSIADARARGLGEGSLAVTFRDLTFAADSERAPEPEGGAGPAPPYETILTASPWAWAAEKLRRGGPCGAAVERRPVLRGITGCLSVPGLRRRIALVDQGDDRHYPLLTVRETLQFGGSCRAPSAIAGEVETKVERVLATLGLTHVADSPVGDATVRGLSGGEKRRLSIGVEMMGTASLFLLDEPSNGLDATAAFELCRALRAVADGGGSVLATLLQPSAEAYAAFDEVALLSRGGRLLYWGPAGDAPLAYFQRLGFRCPPSITAPDFLQAMVTPESARQYAGFEGVAPVARHFARAYRNSPEFAAVDAEVRQLETKQAAGELVDAPSEAMRFGRRYANGAVRELALLAGRRWKLTWRMQSFFVARYVQSLLLAVIAGTLFLKRPNTLDGCLDRVSFISLGVMNFGFMGLAKIEPWYADRAVYEGQHTRAYYRSFTWLLADVVVGVPFSLAEVLLYSAVAFFAAGFQPGVAGARFGIFVYGHFIIRLCSDGIVMAICSAVHRPDVAALLSAMIPSAMNLFAGFLVPRSLIPKPWIWLYYVSIFRYPLEALSVAELHDVVDEKGYDVGRTALDSFAMQTDYSWAGYDLAVSTLFWAAFLFIAWLGVAFLRPPREFPPPDADDEEGEAEDAAAGEPPAKPAPTIAEPSKKLKGQPETGGAQAAASAPPPALLTFRDVKYEVEVEEEEEEDLEGGEGGEGKGGALASALRALSRLRPGGRPKTRKVLLDGVTGFASSGMMLALMGQSGGGKTTLLDVLAGRKTGGRLGGAVALNGRPRDKFFNRLVAYVEQFDELFPTQTVREAVVMSAMLRLDERLPRIPAERKVELADSSLSDVGLADSADALISGASLEMRKRVCIAMELVARPAVLFLAPRDGRRDEVTTGLDAVAASALVGLVRRLCDRGQTVVCTIHQPSSDVFDAFDHLLLLRRGGRVCYFGETVALCISVAPVALCISVASRSHATVLSYFERLGYELPAHRNPADLLLEIAQGKAAPARAAAGSSEEELGEALVAAYKSSDLCRRMAERLAEEERRFAAGAPGAGEVPMKHMYASGLGTQIRVLTARNWRHLWRQPSEFWTNFLTTMFICFLIGTEYWRMGYSQAYARMRVSMCYLIMTLHMQLAVGSIASKMSTRAVYYRERAMGMYKSFAAHVSDALANAPFYALTVLLSSLVIYWLSGMSGADGGARFGFFFLVSAVFTAACQSFASMLAFVCPSGDIAYTIAPFVQSLLDMFNGFMIPVPNIPQGWRWMAYLLWYRYPLESLIANEVQGQAFSCEGEPDCAYQTGEDVMAYYGFAFANQWPNVGVLLAYWAAFEAARALAQRFLVHLRR